MEHPTPDTNHKPDHSIHIVVNGRPRTVEGPTISYAQLVGIAYPDDPNAKDYLYDIHYVGPGVRDGTVGAGGSVHVVNGMSFDVVRTNRS